MEFPKDQIEELKRYCDRLSALTEAGITYLLLEGLRLPMGCSPEKCDALLCPVARDNYPSRLFFSVQVNSSYTRNWNVSNARIGERNWFAFSWNTGPAAVTLAQMLVSHLGGFAKEK